MVEEKVYYSGKKANITNTLVSIGRKRFATRYVSAATSSARPKPILAAIVMILLGGLIAAAFFSSRADYALCFSFGLCMLLAGAAMLLVKRKYTITVTTPIGEVQAFVSHDQKLVAEIIGAVNQAIAERP